ncbi:MAG TPA: enoyl-CoA hydratase/isomerase family protein [Thermoanaerobaculia bacterium]|nr:enoyl-CoA hydratase/isomerase family protein [Thermoanaerobaculia bacterium]
MLAIERHDAVAILRMEHGKANAMDLELARGLVAKLAEIAASGARALVLTGAGTIFSAGVDLYRVIDGGREYLDEFVPALVRAIRELFTFPLPAVAAVNGHAIAGGAILAFACDYRVLAAGPGRMGVPELLVGVPFPGLALEVVRSVVPSHHLQEVVYTGRTYGVEEARSRGMAEEAVAPEALLDRALEVAGQLAAIPPEAFQLTKRQLRRPALEHAAGADPGVLEAWSSPETREKIRQYLARTIGKGRPSPAK